MSKITDFSTTSAPEPDAVLPIVQDGVNRKVAIETLLASVPAGPQGPAGPIGPQGDIGVRGLSGLGFDGVISTSTITPSSSGNKILVVNKSGAFTTGNRVRVINSVNNYFEGTLTVSNNTFTILADYNVGTTTASSWTVTLAGSRGPSGLPGTGVPTGGTIGQSLVKASSDDYDAVWSTVAGGSGTSGFVKVSVSGNSDIVADVTRNYTLTVTAGDGIQLETNSATDTLTISSVSSGLRSRTTLSKSTGALGVNATAVLDVAVSFPGYVLYRVKTSHPAWIRVYASAAARLADSSRVINADPAAGAGVIAEVITTNTDPQIITPGVIGFLADTSATSIPLYVTNLSGSTNIVINVELTVLQIEAL